MSYMEMLNQKIPGYGQQPTNIIYMTMASLIEPKEKEGLINWGAGRVAKYITCLYGNPMGDMILKHVTKYVQDKYRSAAPFHFPEIERIVVGVPYHFPKAKDFITQQAKGQRMYLSCLANYIELFAGISCLDQVLEGTPEYTKFVHHPSKHPIFNPCHIAKRAAYELRVFFDFWNLQFDAKYILEEKLNGPDPILPVPAHAFRIINEDEEGGSEEGEEGEEEAEEEESEAEITTSDTGDGTETESESEADNYMDAEEDEPRPSIPNHDQEVPHLKEADDRHPAFIEAIEEFLDGYKSSDSNRNSSSPGSSTSSNGPQST